MNKAYKFKEKVIKTIRDNNMDVKDTTVVIGVSGGADSVALLNVMCELKQMFGYDIEVCHVNHSIRLNGTAERDSKFVEQMCNNLGIKFNLKVVDIPSMAKSCGLTEEEAGREARYEFFNEVGRKHKKYVIATGANANDNVETMLMRIIRGTTIDGLGAIPYVNGNIIRPILDCSRDEIEEYLSEKGLTHIEDETNAETIFTRNKVRLELLPWIFDNMNPRFIETASRNIKNNKEDADFIASEVNRAFKNALVSRKDGITLDKQQLKNMHPSISKRVILNCIKDITGNQSIKFNCIILDDIIKGINISNKKYTVCKECTVYIEKRFVKIKYNNI